jgi:hypothetical protein
MWCPEVEEDALAIYREADEDGSWPIAVGVLVSRLLKTKIVECRMAGDEEGTFSWVKGKPQIAIRAGIRPARRRWVIGHELAHWWYEIKGYNAPDLERRCDALGAALLVPRKAYPRVVAKVGRSWKAIAAALDTTQSLVVLRCGECEGTPAALVQPHRVIVRGAYPWPDEEAIRALAERRGGGRLRKIAIVDEPNRVALLAA